MQDKKLEKAIRKRPEWCKAVLLIKGRHYWFGLDEFNRPMLAGADFITDALYFAWGIWCMLTGKYEPGSKECCNASVPWCAEGFSPTHLERYDL